MMDASSERNQLVELYRMLRPLIPWIAFSSAMGVGAGAATVALLATINAVLNRDAGMEGNALLIFLALCVIALGGRAASQITINRVGQRLVASIRQSLAQKILSAPIDALERYRTHHLVPILTQDVVLLSDAIYVLSTTVVSLATIIGCMVYLVTLSPFLFALVFVAFSLGGVAQHFFQARAMTGFRKAREHEERLQTAYKDISEGAKELRIHRARRMKMFNGHVEREIEAICSVNSQAINTYVAANSFGSAMYFLLIGLILVWAALRTVEPSLLSAFVLVLLYLRGPVDQVLGMLPGIGRAKVAFLRIANLSSEFHSPEPHLHLGRPPSHVLFENEIELKGVQYSFESSSESSAFTVGPVDLRLRKGEMVFIVGNNGSGKTTLIKLLLGLYPPQQGEIWLDGVRITVEGRDDYRQLFTTIFSDFYLFEDLVADFAGDGESRLNEAAAEYMRRLEIADQVQIKDGAFSTLDLSTGQRKRLALVHAYLEDRHVIVFDEWAADQDPSFRHLFYTKLLPELRDRGHLVIAISHDDRYFYVADRVIQMSAGKIVEDRRTQRVPDEVKTTV